MELHCLKEQQHLLVFLLSSLRCTDLIWAIQTVVMSITSQAGWHTPSAGTDILVDGAWRDYWRRTEYISQHLTVLFFFSGRTSPSRDLLSFQINVEAKKIKNTQKKKTPGAANCKWSSRRKCIGTCHCQVCCPAGRRAHTVDYLLLNKVPRSTWRLVNSGTQWSKWAEPRLILTPPTTKLPNVVSQNIHTHFSLVYNIVSNLFTYFFDQFPLSLCKATRKNNTN